MPKLSFGSVVVNVPWGKEKPRLTVPADHDGLWRYNFRHPCMVLDMGVMKFADADPETVASFVQVQFPHACQVKIRGRDGATNAIYNTVMLMDPERFADWTAFIVYWSSDFMFDKDYLYAFFTRECDRNAFHTLVTATVEADNA